MNLTSTTTQSSTRFGWLMLIIFVGLQTITQAQNLATWSFGVSGLAASPVDAHITAANATYINTGATITLNPPATGTYDCDTWIDGAINTAKYFEVSIAPNTNYNMTVTQFSMLVSNNNTSSGPKSYEIRISNTNFSTFTSIGSGSNITSSNITVSAVISTVILQTVALKVRVYFWGGSAANKLIQMDNAIISGVTQQVALPVNLVSFKGQAAGNSVVLNWSTASEQESKQFVVQRSNDASEFVLVGSRQSAGTTDRQQYYSLTDELPWSGVNYYRLKQVDHDGSTVYSKAIAVRVDASQPYARLAQNPTDGQAIPLRLYQMEAPQVRLSALSGQNIAGQLSLRNNTEATYTPASALAPGLYILTVQEGAVRQTMKVLVK